MLAHLFARACFAVGGVLIDWGERFGADSALDRVFDAERDPVDEFIEVDAPSSVVHVPPEALAMIARSKHVDDVLSPPLIGSLEARRAAKW